ncbi:MAG: DUF1080 domain-containing protein [Pirellulales bacterium]|nr:DUF1080 domain-containing protein [Pirellulales bacterium]
MAPRATSASPELQSEYRPLFNGHDFEGWYVCVADGAQTKDQDIFSVEQGVIRVYGNHGADSNQPFACLITEDSYRDYELHLEYKWGERKFGWRAGSPRDAGVIFHVHGPDRVWPFGVEFQIQEGDSGDIWALNTKVSSRVHALDRKYAPDGKWVTRGLRDEQFARFHRSEYWERPGWNVVEIAVDGNNAEFKLNGHVVNKVINAMRWDESENVYLPLNDGKILLQAEGAEVYYRNIRIRSR